MAHNQDRLTPCTAVVLAGDRGPEDPVAAATGAPCKALASVGGRPLLARVLDTLRAVPAVESIVVVGPDRALVDTAAGLEALLGAADITWIAPAGSPSASAAKALATLAPTARVLLTTADHALLEPAMIEPVLAARGCDLAVGLVEYTRVRRAYPDSRRTAIRLGRGDGYCSCNLFAVHTPAGRGLIAAWHRVEKQRKHPARVIAGVLGGIGLLRYAIRRLSLADAFARLSRRTKIRVCPVLLTQPEAAIDVDSLADLAQVETILAARS